MVPFCKLICDILWYGSIHGAFKHDVVSFSKIVCQVFVLPSVISMVHVTPDLLDEIIAQS